ncbi:hypothetical protein HanHA300_Chr06g0221191 [Helianthus annuus]|nr:hypothetical protein HanHA300_Chr06g0221191 [Helianthus annuus]
MFVAHTKVTNLEAEVVSLNEKIEEAKSDRERVEILSKDRDLAGKDAEIAEKNESLEIDLATEKVKADTAEEARKATEEARQISTSTFNVAWTKQLLRSQMLRVPLGSGYLECTQYVEEALKQHFGTRHCSMTDQADEMLAKAEEVYDNLSLPIMELVVDAVKHDDYVARLKSIFVVLETVV